MIKWWYDGHSHCRVVGFSGATRDRSRALLKHAYSPVSTTQLNLQFDKILLRIEKFWEKRDRAREMKRYGLVQCPPSRDNKDVCIQSAPKRKCSIIELTVANVGCHRRQEVHVSHPNDAKEIIKTAQSYRLSRFIWNMANALQLRAARSVLMFENRHSRAPVGVLMPLWFSTQSSP